MADEEDQTSMDREIRFLVSENFRLHEAAVRAEVAMAFAQAELHELREILRETLVLAPSERQMGPRSMG